MFLRGNEDIVEQKQSEKRVKRDTRSDRKEIPVAEGGPRAESGSGRERMVRYGRIGRWFQTICFMNLPVIGFIYMLVQAFSKKTPAHRREFAQAYLLYRILVLLLAFTVLFILYRIGLDFVDEILKYVKI